MPNHDAHAVDHAILRELERLTAQFITLAEANQEPATIPEIQMKLHDPDLDVFAGPSRSYSFVLPDGMIEVLDELRRRSDTIVSRSEIVRQMLGHGIGMVTDPDPRVEAFLAERADKVRFNGAFDGEPEGSA